MMPALAGLPGKIKTLIDRLTSTRATNLDNLDAAITSRAVASTALSNATWTNALAAELDGLAPAIAACAQETTPLLRPPIAGGYVDNNAAFTASIVAAGIPASLSSSTTYVDVVNYTGQGVLSFAAAQTLVAAQSASIRVVIDGVQLCDTATGTAQYDARCPVGAITQYMIAFEAIAFKVSLQIQTKCSGGSNTARLLYKYRKTA